MSCEFIISELMPLAPGTRIGPYEIGAPLGAGGMGEVYRARDTRLGRDVAIKILPVQFSGDPLRKQRFEREAKAISNLNHPNVCVLYDIGHHQGVDYLVMECLEGESLAKRLEKGALPVSQVLKYGAQIADAMDKAHKSGVIHRDLKPGNIILTSTGAKLLDFGLAKATPAAIRADTPTLGVLETTPVTEEGMVVGTYQYMSPEQIEGKEVDGRSDIFSLGTVLYEMLTGKRAFIGKSQLTVASAILEREPEPISAIKPFTPPALDRAIRRCLAKDAEDRWQTARDLAIELQWLGEADSQGGIRAIDGSKPRNNRFRWIAAAVAGIAALLVAFAWWSGSRQPETLPLYAGISPPEGTSYEQNNNGAIFAVSPDGTQIVSSISDVDGHQHLWLRSLGDPQGKILIGTENGFGPFWSPDSKWIGFYAHGQLNKIASEGGPPAAICETVSLRGASWSAAGDIIFSPTVNAPLLLVSASGGTPRPVTRLNKEWREDSHRWPSFLPDSRKFLYYGRGPEPGIFLGSLDSPEVKLLLKNDSNAVYVEPGYLLYIKEHSLVAQAFDKKRLELKGEPIALAQNVLSSGVSQMGGFSVSQTGMLAYISGPAAETRQLLWLDKTGRVLSTIGNEAAIQDLRLSSDGTRIAATLTDPRTAAWNVWIIDALRGTQTPLTLESSFAAYPVWSPDGNRIAYSSNRAGSVHVFAIATNGLGKAELLTDPEPYDTPMAWSPDGKYLLYVRGAQQGNEYWLLPMSGETASRKLLDIKGLSRLARISPDGRWLLFTLNQSGRSEIFVSEFPVINGKWQVSLDGGTDPRWSHNGKEIFFLTSSGKLMVADFSTKSQVPEIGPPEFLFDAGLRGTAVGTYDVAPDGRFLVARRVHDAPSLSLSLIMNWPAALHKK